MIDGPSNGSKPVVSVSMTISRMVGARFGMLAFLVDGGIEEDIMRRLLVPVLSLASLACGIIMVTHPATASWDVGNLTCTPAPGTTAEILAPSWQLEPNLRWSTAPPIDPNSCVMFDCRTPEHEVRSYGGEPGSYWATFTAPPGVVVTPDTMGHVYDGQNFFDVEPGKPDPRWAARGITAENAITCSWFASGYGTPFAGSDAHGYCTVQAHSSNCIYISPGQWFKGSMEECKKYGPCQ
jgi:hypothetical protein